MKETPIMMSGNHPRLISDLIKTMTRRTWGLEKINKNPDVWKYQGLNGFGDHLFYPIGDYPDEFDGVVKCPYGQVGDRLWVRETHYCYGMWWKSGLTKTGKPRYEFLPVGHRVAYLDNPPIGILRAKSDIVGWYKRPSIFMYEWASRILLEITELRAEMLRSISETDAWAEGGYSINEFIELFLKINHLPEDANPWNWAKTFKVVK